MSYVCKASRIESWNKTVAARVALVLAGMTSPVFAQAQVIDRIDVQRVGEDAEISIRFVTPVQYLRHSPPAGGHALNVYLQLLREDASVVTPTTSTVPETKTVPRGELASGVSVHYPEPDSSLLVNFPESTTYRVRQGRDNRSIIISAPAGKLPSLPRLGASDDVEHRAGDQLARAKDALGRGDTGVAVETLNSLLGLPPNAATQEAQELIGLARERSGEAAKAKAEYELYLKQYPQGDGAARVRERIAKLGAVPAAEASARPARRQEDTGWMVSGGFSQYRSHGRSSTIIDPVRVTVLNAGQQFEELINGQTINRTVQNTLISNFDLSMRRRTESTDNRVVVRDVDTIYYQNPTKPNYNRLNAAYFEQSNRDYGYLARLGRQTGNGGGILGRFDGGLVGYNLNPTWKLNAVAGDVVEFNSPYKKNFYGASIDMQSMPDSWGGSVFAIEQRAEGKLDRRAVGVEARFFDARKNLYALLDYDVSFNALNIAMLQANWTTEAGTNLYLTVDRRRTPVLLLTSAVDTQFGSTVSSLTAGLADRAIRDDIVHITPMANMLSVGLMHPLTPKWQVGGDFQVSNLRTTEASSSLPTAVAAVAGTGNTLVYTVRGIGNEILFSQDMLVLSGSQIDAKHTTAATTYSAQSYSATHVARPNDDWQIHTSLRYYTQNRSDGEHLTRVNPILRGVYRFRNNISFEAEANYEREVKTAGTSPGRSNGTYYYAGYRWDFL
ncbi:MAG: tetratricopeptide repeat protein [Betaproteobacteria bacterium]